MNQPDMDFVVSATQLSRELLAELDERTDAGRIIEIRARLECVLTDIERAVRGETDSDGPENEEMILPCCSTCYLSYQKCVNAGGTNCAQQYNYCMSHCTYGC